MKKVSILILFISTLIAFQSCRVKLDPVVILTFKEKIEKLFPNGTVTKLEKYDEFTRVYKVIINQPINFKQKELGSFEQIVYLSHVDEEMPMVLITESRLTNPSTHELSKLFKGNQIQIEDRTGLESVPSDVRNRMLADEDIHTIITKLKRLYVGKWISTGTGVGAEIALSHKYKYPWDTKTTIVYNPKLNSISPEAFEFLENKGKEIMYFYKEGSKFIPGLKPHVDAYKLTWESNAFSFSINSFSETKKQEVYEKLQDWLGYSVTLFPIE
mgnify:CR=1 FL=1